MAHEFPFAVSTPTGLLAARVYRDVPDLVTPRPTVVVTGSWLTVQQQMPRRYAEALAARGLTAVTMDFSGFGSSPGAPRQAELPERKIADIVATATAVSRSTFAAGVGHLGVCASAQYALQSVLAGAPIDALASVAGWFHDSASVAPLYGGPDGVAERIARGADALDLYRQTGEVRTVPAYAPGDERAGMFLELSYYADRARGAIPQWRNEMAELSWLFWLTFDGLRNAAQMTRPALFVHSDDAVLPHNVRAIAAAIPRAELVWAEGTQVDFYDRPEQVEPAADRAAAFFRDHL